MSREIGDSILCKCFTFVTLLCIVSMILPNSAEQAGRLLNGQYAKEGQFPYTVTIRNKDNVIFGGSLISTNVVLTCAAEVVYKDEFMIYMGTIDALNPDNVEGVVVNTSNYKAHKKFDSVDHENDIALLFLQGHFFIKGIIEPVRLPSLAQRHQQYNKDYNAILSGVGMSTRSNKNRMQHLKLRVISNEECKNSWELGEIFDTQICTKSRSEQISPCHGDQGGPLTVEDSDGIVTQIGISSLFNCGRSYPHIYTRVVNYLEWIAKNGGPPLIPSSKYHKKN